MVNNTTNGVPGLQTVLITYSTTAEKIDTNAKAAMKKYTYQIE